MAECNCMSVQNVLLSVAGFCEEIVIEQQCLAGHVCSVLFADAFVASFTIKSTKLL